jgi:hypothetical protein
MSTYPVRELLQQWKNHNLDAEQAIGHILQHLVALYEQDEHTSHRLNTLTRLLPVPEEPQSPASSPPGRKRKR